MSGGKMNFSDTDKAWDWSESELYLGDPQDYIDRMVTNGFSMVYTRPNVLLLDLDGPEAMMQLTRNFDSFRKSYPVCKTRTWESQNHGRHVEITLQKDMDFLERLICQTYLGSDTVKEYLSMLRWQTTGGAVSFLAQPPKAQVTEVNYENT
jgi:hypothetical protein